jgi:hypothetical protein
MRTEDQVRDEAKIILGFDDEEENKIPLYRIMSLE